jgi:hypothetical protein
MNRKLNCKRQIAIFFFLAFAIAGPPILSTGYEKLHKYITQGRWDDYSYHEVIGEDGKIKTVKIPLMIDDWNNPSPWKMVPTIIIFILCPVIGVIGIWRLTSSKENKDKSRFLTTS